MKIAVPSMGDDDRSQISSTFGRCKSILIYDSETKKYSVAANPGISLKDGSGIKAVEIIIKAGADILLTKEIGVKAYSVLAKERVAVMLINAVVTVDEAVKTY